MNNSLIPLIKELERGMDKILKLNGVILEPKPLITIQSAGRRNAVGWYAGDIWKEKKQSVSEINLSAEHLQRGFEPTMETLVHELAHALNYAAGIKDCSSHQYHNKKFKERAESLGLEVQKTKSRGWCITSLSKQLKKDIKSFGLDEKLFSLSRIGLCGESAPGKQPTKMKLWTCGCTKVRCAVVLSAECILCHNDFKEQ